MPALFVGQASMRAPENSRHFVILIKQNKLGESREG